MFLHEGTLGQGNEGERGHGLPNDSFKSLTPALSAGGCQVVTLRSETGHAGAGASAERRREVSALVRARKEWEGVLHVPTHPKDEDLAKGALPRMPCIQLSSPAWKTLQ